MLRDFENGRRAVSLKGRPFFIRRVSLRAVNMVSRLFSERIMEVVRVSGGKPSTEAVLDAFTVGDLSEMFGAVLDPPDVEWLVENMDRAMAEQILGYVFAMNDVYKIAGAHTRNAEPEAQQAEGAPAEGASEGGEQGEQTVEELHPMEVVVDALAQRYGVAPHEVMEWPVEEVMRIVEIINRQMTKAEEAAAEAERTQGRGAGRTLRVEAEDAPAALHAALGGEYIDGSGEVEH